MRGAAPTMWRAGLAAALLAALLGGVPAPLAASPGRAGVTGSVEGTVRDAVTGQPVVGATASLVDLGLTARSDAAGQFAWRDAALPAEVFTTTVRVAAEGYGPWEITGVRVRAGDTLLLTARLGHEAVSVSAPLPRETWAEPAGESAALLELAGVANSQPPPATIRVRLTGTATCSTTRPYTVVVVNFRDYVKHVLPNEWIPSWNAESLRTGAVAAKMYAWYWVARGGKWPDADVYDSTCDQVYNPNVAYASTNAAVDDTWNWRLTRDGLLFPAYYRAYAHQCDAAGLTGACLGQWESQWMAQARSTWPEILAAFYANTALAPAVPFAANLGLRFEGTPSGHGEQVVVWVTDKDPDSAGPPVDVGSADFTLDFWMKAEPGELADTNVVCGPGRGWQDGVMVFDRERDGQDRDFGLAIADGRLAFGVDGEGTGAHTLCGQTTVVDGAWHHVAAARRRSNGFLWLWVDGTLEAAADGPDGDISYPDTTSTPGDGCARHGLGLCLDSAPYLAIGAAKEMAGQSRLNFSGWLDEIRISDGLRYTSAFEPSGYATADAATLAVYHLDDLPDPRLCAGAVVDSSGASGGPSHGRCRAGGASPGPEWVRLDRQPWAYWIRLPSLPR